MSSDLYFNSIKYISAKRAGEITGYSSDYIGQLCRGKKLTTQRVGKSWYVSEESLNQYVAFAAEQARLVREIQSTTLKEVQAKNTKVATAPATPVVPVISITSPASTVAPVSTSAVAAPVITEIVTEKLAPVIKIEEKESKATVTASNFKLPTSNLKLKASSLKSQFTKTAHSVAGKFYSHYPLILSKLSDSVRKNHSLIYGDVAKKAFGLAFVFLFGFSLAGATTYFRADLAKLPKKGYAVLSDINTFYAKKLTTLYIQTGEQVLGSTSALVSGVQDCGSNPALCIRKSLSSVATLQANNVDTAGKKILAFVENTHAQTFAYVSSALDFSDLKNTTVAIDGPHQGALDGDHQLAQVSSAKQTVVDKAGVAVYTEVQSWFEKTGGALLSLLGQKNSYVVVAPSTKSTPANTITLAPTKKVVASVPTYNPSVIVKNTNTIIERVVESNASAASLSALDQQIKDLSGSINNRFAGLSTGGGGSVTNVYQQIANTQRIDQLHNTTINNPTIIGGSIDAMRIIGVSTLNSDVLNTGTLTAGTFTASTSTFNGVTYFAGNVGIGITNPQYALDILGNINLTGGITAAGSTIGGDFAVTGTTTLNKLVATSATSTNLFATNSIFANSTTTNAYITSLFAANATTTNAYITSLITAGASSTNAYATNFTANNATVGNLVATSTFSAPTLSLTGVAVNSLLSTNSAGLIVATSTPTFGNFNATSTTATSTLSTGGLAIGGSQFIVQQNSGNVGIGTATPGAKLEISNSDYNQLFLRATSVGGSAALEMKTTVGNPFQIFASGTDTVSMYSGGQGTLFMGTSKVGINSGGTSSFGAGTAFVVMNGNAGIGTTTPLTRLSVFGDSLVAGTETASSFIATSTTATSTFAGGLAIATNRFVVDRSTGNVGVGTASPTELLDVRGNIIIPTGNAYRFGDSSVQIYRNTVPSNSLTVAASGGVMFNGNIGIGSTTPGYRLSVAGSGFFDGGTVTAANIIATSSLSAPTLTLTGVAVNSLLSTNSAGLIVATSTPTFGNFIATSTTATSTIAGGLAVQTNKLIVDRSTGFVGINTPTPTSSLHVNGDMRLNSGSRFYFESTGTNNALYRDISSGSSVLTSPADIIFGSGSLASTYMTVKQSGNVGIGTTTPSNSLTVSGSANFGTNGTFKISDNAGNNYALGGPSSNILSMDSNSFLIRNAAGTTVNTRFGVGGGVAIGSIYGGVDPGDGKLFASNNIGIGTTSPQQRLEVAGNLAFTGALMPNYQAGVAGTVLMSNGTGVAPTWTTVTAVASSTFFA
ncbi:MAG: hypothetical protein NTV02_01465, partial [Candidatus Zambryskibacteria bacterium]|nr:hypothetical protein [Candidatus Zambryskibacteria bacterium]